MQIIISAILAVLVLAGISMMSKVKTAVAGNLLSAFAMLCGIVATEFFADVLDLCDAVEDVGDGLGEFVK